jgi:hypothetical protein
MKLTSIKTLTSSVLLAVVLAAGNYAKAGLITGSINFDGVATTNTGNLGSATAFTTISNTFTFPVETGDYSSVSIFTPVTFTPFSFSAAGVTPLWTFTVGSTVYSFDATTIVIAGQGPNFLNVKGQGWAFITGFTPTKGVWSITDTSVGGDVFTFGADTAAAPDSGTTAMLIALGLAGIAIGVYAQRRQATQA